MRSRPLHSRTARARHAPPAALLALALAISGAAAGAAQESAGAEAGPVAEVGAGEVTISDARPPRRADGLPEPVYQARIEAELLDDGVIRGHQKLRWQNTSDAPVPDLELHLYLNAFANDHSTFMVESGGRLRGDEFDDKRFGYIEVEAIRLAGGGSGATALGGADLKGVEEFIAPDDGNPDDRTVARYPLPEPLPPGGWVEVEIDFESRLPDVFARTGIHKDFVLAGQWFPKIAVWEAAGERGRPTAGWNAHQFHAYSEFYADFGDYEVSLTLPERYGDGIGATGRRLSTTGPADGKVTVTYVQEGVHDFAWTADPEFVVVTDRFDPEADVPEEMRRRWAETLGLPADQLALSPVEIRLLVRPENRSQAGRYLGAAKAAIRGYGLRLGAYPYPTLTLVDPAWGAFGAGGMEYPTFITLGTHPMLDLPPLRGVRFPEMVTVHEFGHQFFQGMIASNEFEEAWLDEGVNSYYEMEVMEDEYPSSITLPGIYELSPFEADHSAIAGGGYTDFPAAPAWRYRTRGSYGLNSYPRPALTLRHLEGLLGEETFHRAMRSFFQRWQFGHPSTADFEATFSRAAGRDLGWFFDQALHSTRPLDYAVRRVRTERVSDRRGFFWRDGERTEVGADEDDDDGDESGAAEVEDDDDGDDGDDDGSGEDDEDDDGEPKRWRSFAEVVREGEFIHPVTVEFRFDDGRSLRREWAGRSRWARWTFEGPAKLVSAEVDPDGWMALDVDRVNNGKSVEPDRAPALAYLTDILYWLTALFQAAALLA